MQEKKQHDEKKHSHRQYGRLRCVVHVTCEISTDARTHAHAQKKTHTFTIASNPSFGFVSDLSPFFRSKARPAHAAPVRRQTRVALIRHHIQHALAALCTNLPPSRAHRRKPVRPQPLALFLRPPSASCAARGVGSPSSAAAGSTSAASRLSSCWTGWRESDSETEGGNASQFLLGVPGVLWQARF